MEDSAEAVASGSAWTPKLNPFNTVVPFSGLAMPVPFNEVLRLERLREYNLAERSFSEQYSNIVKLAMRIFDCEIAMITLHDEADILFKVNFGTLEGVCGITRDISFCAHAILPDAPPVFVVKDALKDPRFRQSPLVLGPPNIRFYAGAKLEVETGFSPGTLCIISSQPKETFGVREQSILLSLAENISFMCRQEFQMRRQINSLGNQSSLRALLSSCVNTMQSLFNDATIDVDTAELENMNVQESVLRTCVLELLTSACQLRQNNQNNSAIVIRARENEQKLRVEVLDPLLILDDITIDDVFSAHMISSDSLMCSRYPNLGYMLTSVKEHLRECGGTCGWTKAQNSAITLFIELPCTFELHITSGTIRSLVSEKPEDRALASPSYHTSSLGGKTILIVDASAIHRAFIRDALLAKGAMEVHVAINGLEALNLLKLRTFDAVLVDLVLPVLNGMEFLHELKRLPSATTPGFIIGMSNAAERADIATARLSGMNVFLNKPVDPDDLSDILSKHFARLTSVSATTSTLDTPITPARQPRFFGSLRNLFRAAGERISFRSRTKQGVPHLKRPNLFLARTSSIADTDTSSPTDTSPTVRESGMNLYERMAEELDFFISTPARRNDFVRFCVYEQSHENVRFLIALNDARRYLDNHAHDEDQQLLHYTLLSFIRNIFRMYLAPSAPQALNISSGLSVTTRQKYDSQFAESKVAGDSLDSIAIEETLEWLGPVYDEVFNLVLRDTWLRFAKTEDYARGKLQLESITWAFPSKPVD